jgi:hypothetical protein
MRVVNRLIAGCAGLVAMLAVSAPGMAAKEVRPSCGPPGTWCKLGTTHAKHAQERDAIVVKGADDEFRAIKFKVKDAPLNLRRLVVIFQNGGRQDIATRDDIPKGGESRRIDLKGSGQRKIDRIEFWYDTKGLLQGDADVTIFGLR